MPQYNPKVFREIECFTQEEREETLPFNLIFIMYMINYYIASDYQKIVRDIIFYMYLISVHIETCALAGPNAELFYGRNFNYMLSLKLTVRLIHGRSH